MREGRKGYGKCGGQEEVVDKWKNAFSTYSYCEPLQPALTQCDVGPMRVPIELLSTYFNLPQPSVMLV